MATYASYKKVANDSIVDGTITSDDIAHGNGNNYGCLLYTSPSPRDRG